MKRRKIELNITHNLVTMKIWRATHVGRDFNFSTLIFLHLLKFLSLENKTISKVFFHLLK